MKHKLVALLLPIIIIFGLGTSVRAAELLTAKLFAGPDGKLDRQQAAFYIAHRDKEPLSKFMVPGQTTLDPKKVVDAMARKLDDLRSKTHHEAPWTWQELDAACPPKAALPLWKQIDGLTEKKELGNDSTIKSLGPFMLRKSIAELTKSLSDAKGATLAYSKNGLKSGGGVLNSDGVLDYPTMWNLYQGGRGRSLELGMHFAGEWKVAQVQEDPKKNLEELTFSVPLTLYVSPGAWITGASDPSKASSGLLLFQGKPYFLTDFSFRDEIYGVEATGEYVGSVLGSRWFHLGGFQNLGAFGLQYQLRLIPKLDYSVTAHGGIHTTRKESDDWLCLGGTGSLDLRLGLQTFNALDTGVSYQFLQTVSGSGGYSHLFKAHTTLWLIENVGATIEYSKGDTPVADNPIDLISFGFEFKY